MLVLYSDDGSNFKLNKVPHKVTCGFKGGRLIQIKITKKDKNRTATVSRLPLSGSWPPNTGNSVCISEKLGL